VSDLPQSGSKHEDASHSVDIQSHSKPIQLTYQPGGPVDLQQPRIRMLNSSSSAARTSGASSSGPSSSALSLAKALSHLQDDEGLDPYQSGTLPPLHKQAVSRLQRGVEGVTALPDVGGSQQKRESGPKGLNVVEDADDKTFLNSFPPARTTWMIPLPSECGSTDRHCQRLLRISLYMKQGSPLSLSITHLNFLYSMRSACLRHHGPTSLIISSEKLSRQQMRYIMAAPF
jgi:hypothetical protein